MRYYQYQAAILSVPGCDTIGTRLRYFSGTIKCLKKLPLRDSRNITRGM